MATKKTKTKAKTEAQKEREAAAPKPKKTLEQLLDGANAYEKAIAAHVLARKDAADVPVFVKQLDITQFPEHLRIRQVPWATEGNE